MKEGVDGRSGLRIEGPWELPHRTVATAIGHPETVYRSHVSRPSRGLGASSDTGAQRHHLRSPRFATVGNVALGK